MGLSSASETMLSPKRKDEKLDAKFEEVKEEIEEVKIEDVELTDRGAHLTGLRHQLCNVMVSGVVCQRCPM